MLCATCAQSFSEYATFRAHKPSCGLTLWGEHYAAREAGKRRKAARIAAQALGVTHESKPMSPEAKARLATPEAQAQAKLKRGLRKQLVRDLQHQLAVAGRRRRRILT
jgi:hypothetical protein